MELQYRILISRNLIMWMIQNSPIGSGTAFLFLNVVKIVCLCLFESNDKTNTAKTLNQKSSVVFFLYLFFPLQQTQSNRVCNTWIAFQFIFVYISNIKYSSKNITLSRLIRNKLRFQWMFHSCCFVFWLAEHNVYQSERGKKSSAKWFGFAIT